MDRDEFLRLAANPSANLKNLRFIQEEIAHRVILKDDFKKPIDYIGGVDSAYLENTVITACVIMKWPNLELVEQKIIKAEVFFPYISTFFAFREGPSILAVLEQVVINPSILMINSHGILHPTFAGCASHLGVITDLPTIGTAKETLCGEWKAEPNTVGDWTPITFKNKPVGGCLFSQKKMKPIFISPGHRISLQTTMEIVKKTLRKSKLPEPLQFAHNLATKERKKLVDRNS